MAKNVPSETLKLQYSIHLINVYFLFNKICLTMDIEHSPYPPVLYPIPSAPYLRPTMQTPLNIFTGRNRIQRLTHDKRKYLAYLERSKELHRIGSVLAANSCENRYLCELGLVAVNEKNATKSANTLYTALWQISNEYV